MPTASSVRKQIAAGTPDPLYLLVGSDETAKLQLAGKFGDLVEPELRSFNVERFYGDASAAAVIDSARTLPLAGTRRVILVIEAERLLEPRRESEAIARGLAVLESYILAPAPHTALVLIAGQLDRRRRLTTLLLKHATVVDCDFVEDARDPVQWVRNTLARAGLQIDPAASAQLIRRTGGDVARLRAEVERLSFYAAGSGRITEADVLEVVAPQTSEDDWGVTRAIEQGSVAGALRELAQTLDAGAVPHAIVGQLGWFVRTKLPPSRVRAAVDAVFRTDLDLKSSAGDPRVLLERLVVELCGNDRL